MHKYLFQDLKLRKKFLKLENLRLIYKFLSSDFSKTFSQRLFFQKKLNNLMRKGNLVRIKNRCLITGRGRGIIRRHRLARHNAKNLMSLGFFVGFKRASW